jgi:hypothetical protein
VGLGCQPPLARASHRVDRTHLRFFVRETAIELATCGGLAIVAAANAQPFTFPDARFLLSKTSGGRLDEFLAKQWLVVAEPAVRRLLCESGHQARKNIRAT